MCRGDSFRHGNERQKRILRSVTNKHGAVDVSEKSDLSDETAIMNYTLSSLESRDWRPGTGTEQDTIKHESNMTILRAIAIENEHSAMKWLLLVDRPEEKQSSPTGS